MITYREAELLATYYICPTCKTKCDEEAKWCEKCGTWLLSDTFPAKKVQKKPKRASGALITLIVIGFLAYLGYANQDSLPALSNGGKIAFEEIPIGEQYVISQLVVNTLSTTAAADFKAVQELRDPVEVVTVYYDESGQRLGTASSLITKQLAAGQTTTISFDFEEANSLGKIREVRVEVHPLSPLQLLERAADKMNDLEIK
ncbi:hypothetical protein MO973_33630 [Paenibacillus sp. TRM 82003]|nr:hypothetical protein [Paenibacillus sp. TRM 82003]